MKKDYIVPSMMMVFVETQGVIATSPLKATDETPKTTFNQEEYNEKFNSRRHDIWEDEEEY